MWGDGWVRRGTQATIPTHPPPPPGNGQPWPALCAQSYGCQACKHMRIATHHDTAFHVDTVSEQSNKGKSMRQCTEMHATECGAALLS